MDWYGARWGWYIGIEKGINNYERERERERYAIFLKR
jgi:hypothetical protein